MITVALTLARKFWKEIAIALVVVAAYFYVTNLQDTVADQKTKITKLEADNATLKDNNKLLGQALGTNNEAIGKLAAGADVTNQAFSKLSGAVNQQSRTLDARLKSILEGQKPVTCEDAIQYLLSARKEYQ